MESKNECEVKWCSDAAEASLWNGVGWCSLYNQGLGGKEKWQEIINFSYIFKKKISSSSGSINK